MQPNKYFLRIKITASGFLVSEPIIEFENHDLSEVVMKVPVKQEMKEYQLWQLFKGVLEDNPDININKYDLIDAWIWDKLINRHPLRNRITAIDWTFVEKMEQKKEVPVVFDDMLDKILNMI